MNVVGESDISLQYKHHRHYTTSLISLDVRFNIRVAWHILLVLYEPFPACLCATQHETIQESLISRYPEVFRDSLSEEFSALQDISGVRSFLGLMNQLSGFVPDFAHTG